MKEKTLSELQNEELKCVFCDKSSKEVMGGYFKKRFICNECSRGLNDIESYLVLPNKKVIK